MSGEENKAIVRRFYDEWNKGSLQGVYDLFSEDVVDHNPGPGQGAGKAGLKQALEIFRNAFPDSQIAIEQLVAEGDKVVDHATFRGTHTGDLFGVPPTGKPVIIHASDVYRIADGKIVELWHIEDIVGIMQQIGAMPAQAQPQSATSGASHRAGSAGAEPGMGATA